MQAAASPAWRRSRVPVISRQTALQNGEICRLYEGLLKNPHFPKPPVDLGLFKTKIDKYSAAITATMGGAKIAFSQRDSLREDLTKMLLELAGYVEAESYNDPAIFATSGLEALPSAHIPHQPLDRPRIPKFDHG